MPRGSARHEEPGEPASWDQASGFGHSGCGAVSLAGGERSESGAVAAETRRFARPPLRLVTTPPLRVVDVAMWYGERSGGIRTYLDAKTAFARRTGAFEHRLVVPGIVRKVTDHTCSLPSIRVATSNGYRWPIGTRPLVDLLRELEPDVVLLHDPFWAPRAVQSLGVPVVMVHHGSLDLDANAIPGPTRVYRPALAHWLRRAYAGADAVMSACDPRPDTGRGATMPLRFGLDAAFYPEGDEQRGEHVLYAGRIGREKGVFELLEAAALSAEPWPLWLMGTGSAREGRRRCDPPARTRRSRALRRIRARPRRPRLRLPQRPLRRDARRARDLRPRRVRGRRLGRRDRRLHHRPIRPSARRAWSTPSSRATPARCWRRSKPPARLSRTA